MRHPGLVVVTLGILLPAVVTLLAYHLLILLCR
jgi:hypothetical protein